MRLPTLVTLPILLAVSACAAPVATSDGPWVGDITTAGDVTTVINESGSLWGGAATVVEEASMGGGQGADAMVFGNVAWVYEAAGTIYVVDAQGPAVRTFDRDGNFLGNLGTPVPGDSTPAPGALAPGEYTQPYRLVVGPDRRIFLSEPSAARVNVYAADGTPLAVWTATMSGLPASSLAVNEAGTLWVPIDHADPSGQQFPAGMQSLPEGEPGARVLIEQFDGRAVPAAAVQGFIWTPAGGDAAIVGRASADSYRFEVQRAGRAELAVQRFWEPVPVNPDFNAWFLAVYGRERPPTDPPYISFTRAVSGEIWVTRPAAPRRVTDCVEDPSDPVAARANPCWRPAFGVDAFAADGRYLGEVDLPEDVIPFARWMHIDGDMLIARSLQDGVQRVKRYRLVTPAPPGR